MDPIVLTVAFKGVAGILAILIGFLVARYGFHLYKDGVGAGRDSAAFSAGKIQIRAQSVGSVVMGTAFLWAWAGVFVSPSLNKTGSDWVVSEVKVRQEKLDDLVNGPPLKVGISEQFDLTKSDTGELKSLLAEALNKSANRSQSMKIPNFDEFKRVSPESIQALKTESGSYILAAPIDAGSGLTRVAFTPRHTGNEIQFLATAVSVIKAPQNSTQR